MRTRIAIAAVLFVTGVMVVSTAEAQRPRTALKNVAPEQVVERIAYCRGEYRLRMANGAEHRFAEFDLRLKTDASTYGPELGKPVLLPAGMRGDRAQLIFSSPEDFKQMVMARCDGGGG